MRDGDLWVFGYGSLMWRPDFAFIERAKARLEGYHRSFCISSTHHRGNVLRPGLVLGLDRGGVCDGIAYRVAADRAAEVRHYLRARELISGVYREAFLPVALADGSGRTVAALAYVVERAHPSYVRDASLALLAHVIRGARGVSGDNLDYLVNTVAHLVATGIRERRLERLVTLAGAHIANLGALRRADGLTSACAAGVRSAAGRRPIAVRRMRPCDRRRFTHRLRVGEA